MRKKTIWKDGKCIQWTADRHARRVPNFVFEMTGLDTKKKIVAKYGYGVVFTEGKPCPPVKTAPKKTVPRIDKVRRVGTPKKKAA